MSSVGTMVSWVVTRSGGDGPWPGGRVLCSGGLRSMRRSARPGQRRRGGSGAVRSGKMPPTSVRRRISLLSGSCGLFDQTCRQISRGKVVNARTSPCAASKWAAALGNLASRASRTCRIWAWTASVSGCSKTVRSSVGHPRLGRLGHLAQHCAGDGGASAPLQAQGVGGLGMTEPSRVPEPDRGDVGADSSIRSDLYL